MVPICRDDKTISIVVCVFVHLSVLYASIFCDCPEVLYFAGARAGIMADFQNSHRQRTYNRLSREGDILIGLVLPKWGKESEWVNERKESFYLIERETKVEERKQKKKNVYRRREHKRSIFCSFWRKTKYMSIRTVFLFSRLYQFTR